MNRYYTDIALDENWQPAVRSNGDFATVSDLDCLMQEIRLEALTTQGELFFDPEFGWSLPDFLHLRIDDLTLLEIEQRVYARLAARDKIETSSIAVKAQAGDTVLISAVWRWIGDSKTNRLQVSVGRVDIEVIAID